MRALILLSLFFLYLPLSASSSQTILSADGPGNTYELITSTLALPGGDPIEEPDCTGGHTSFGRHIDEIFDADLNENVFRFFIHTDEDDDRCIATITDRQRNEIKTYDQSPDNLLGVEDEIVEYKWKFKLDAGFQSSSRFTHLHQLKAVGGTESSHPLITLTTRKGTPDQLELRHGETTSSSVVSSTDLTPFKGEWVEVTETVTYGENGTYNLTINKVSDNSTLFSYADNDIRMWRTDADFIRPKWGVYRSLEFPADLRDEEVLFNNFSIEELAATTNTTCSTSAPLGTGTSSSSGRGPFQRSDSLSSSVYSRGNLVYTQAELAGLGILPGSLISEIQWDLGSTNIITATGDATMDIYMRNSSVTAAMTDTWENIIAGSALVGSYTFNTTNNFPGVKGFMTFALSTPLVYNGGTLEVAVDWDCSGLVSTNSNPNALFSGNGSLNWNWDATTHNSIVYRTGSSSPPTNITSNLKMERVNTQFCTTAPISTTCDTSTPLGTGTSSSSGRGPFQRSDSLSSSVYSRANLVYTQAELAGLGITNGSVISEIQWDLGSTNIITATGDATLDIYMRNSSATAAMADTWTNLIAGSALVGNYTFNTTNNFPGVKGFITFELSTPFVYNGGTLEVGVDWDCSGLVSTNSNPNALFSGNGSLNWNWDATTHVSLAYRAGSSSAPTNISNLRSERVNTQFCTTVPGAPATCSNSTPLGTGTSSSATRGPFQRSDSTSASVYSRANLVYTQAELAGLGITSGSTISEIQWDLGSTNIITASNDALLDVYMKNSSATMAVEDTWANTIAGSTLVGSYTFNTTDNFPGVKGFLTFTLSTPFVYTGGTLEIGVDWNCSNLVPADPAQPNALFSGNGSLNWNWDNTTHTSLIYRSGSSSPPSDLTGGNLKMQRVNTKFCFLVSTCSTAEVLYYPDTDMDGFGDANDNGTLYCPGDEPANYVTDNTDCVDTDMNINPNATEICDGIDNNCDNLIDDADPNITGQTTWYADNDMDGFGDPNNSMSACSQPANFVADNTDCDDSNNAVSMEVLYYPDIDSDGLGDFYDAGTLYCPGSEPANFVTDNSDCDDSNGTLDLRVDDNPVAIGLYKWNNILSIGFVAAGTVSVDTVVFEGSEQVVLEPGFQAIAGSDFTARIAPLGPCPPASSPLVEDISEETIQPVNRSQKENQVTEDNLRIFPNPLADETIFEYSLGEASKVNIIIIDAQGSIVSFPVSNQYKEKGIHKLNYNAGQLPEGVYTILLRTDRSNKSQRMMIIRN